MLIQAQNLPEECDLPCRLFSAREWKLWQSSILSIYGRMKKRAKQPYEIQCDDIAISVFANVYAPRLFTDSLWFARELPKIIGSKTLLEIGTGTGLIAIACARNGARVVGTDINPDAVKNARANVLKNKLDIPILEGSLYEPVGLDDRFDYIFWAHPFNNWKTPVRDMLMRSGRDYKYKGLEGYIVGAKNHLKLDGRILLGTGDSADLPVISLLAAKNGYRLKLLDEAEMPLEEGGKLFVKYLIYELVSA